MMTRWPSSPRYGLDDGYLTITAYVAEFTEANAFLFESGQAARGGQPTG